MVIVTSTFIYIYIFDRLQTVVYCLIGVLLRQFHDKNYEMLYLRSISGTVTGNKNNDINYIKCSVSLDAVIIQLTVLEEHKGEDNMKSSFPLWNLI